MTTPWLRGVAVAVTVAALLTGCSGDDAAPAPRPTSSAAPRTPDRPPAPPEAGSCHRLDYATAVQPTAEDTTVPCRKPHTSRTIKVGRLRTAVDGHLLAVDAVRVRRQPARYCAAAFDAAVGGSPEQRRLSMLAVASFSPSVEESDRGATWIRCDVVAVVEPERLGPLPAAVRGLLDTSQGRERFGMCGTAKPGTPDFSRVACSQPHTWRATASVDVPPGAKGGWPGAAKAQAAGKDRCTEAARANADDSLNYEWGFEWPDRMQWRSGRHYGICWAPA
ncbi:septum formation family protein [Nocardioides daejeonensis]|uniref:septum formation family protein n=1 Tax=Nocardioides daejeonensis TaxID=1046556 RepID=UPI0013A532F8|nr:septum formation family protein [Nocardioides daejeonensis]